MWSFLDFDFILNFVEKISNQRRWLWRRKLRSLTLVITYMGRGKVNNQQLRKANSRLVWLAQLAERSLPKPEVRSSNPTIGTFLSGHLFTVNCIEKTKIKKKRPGMAHFKNQAYKSW